MYIAEVSKLTMYTAKVTRSQGLYTMYNVSNVTVSIAKVIKATVKSQGYKVTVSIGKTFTVCAYSQVHQRLCL